MSRRLLPSPSALAIVIATSALVPVPVAGQSQTAKAATKAAARTLPRTPWGAPDLQGVWDYRTITLLERPDSLAGKAVLTGEEAAAYEAQENRRNNRDLVDLVKGSDFYPALAEGGVGGVVVPYNEFWYDRGDKLVSNRTSLIVDPPDGKIPPTVRPRATGRQGGGGGGGGGAADGGLPANPEDLGLGNRCVARGVPRVSGA